MVDCGNIIQTLKNTYGGFTTMYKNLREDSKGKLTTQKGLTDEDKEVWKIINDIETERMCKDLYERLDKNPELEECLQDIEEVEANTIYQFCNGKVSIQKYKK